MRLLITLLLLVIPCQAQVTLAQKAQWSTPTTGFTLGSSSTAHNSYAIGILDEAGSSSVIQTPTDNNSNTWHLVGSQIQLPGFTNWGIRLAYTCDISVATHNPVTITVPFSTGTSGEVVLTEFAGTKTGSSTICLDQNTGQSIADTGLSNTPYSSGNVTTTVANEGALGYGVANSGTIAHGSGWTSTDPSVNCVSAFICGEYQILSSTQTLGATFSSSAAHDTGLAYIITLSGGGGPVGYPMVIKNHAPVRVPKGLPNHVQPVDRWKGVVKI